MTLAQFLAKQQGDLTEFLRASLRENEGNVARTARALEAPRSNIIRLIAGLGLSGEVAGREGRPPSAPTK